MAANATLFCRRTDRTVPQMVVVGLVLELVLALVLEVLLLLLLALIDWPSSAAIDEERRVPRRGRGKEGVSTDCASSAGHRRS